MSAEFICCGTAVSALLMVVGLLGSVAQVDQNEYGLVFNWITKTVGSDVYHGGIHLVGFWNSFVRFPATVQTIEFSDRKRLRTADPLHTRTKEGLALHLAIAFQYRLKPEGLPALYKLTNMQYEALFIRLAREQLLGAAAAYEGPQYWIKRKEIGDMMQDLVKVSLNKNHASVWDLQVLSIDLPDPYEDSITKTQVQKQEAKTKENEQIAAGIRADTEVLQAVYEAKIKVVQAGAEANYTKVTKVAEAQARQRHISAEADALGYTREKLGLSDLGAVEYQQLAAYANMQNATFLANILGATPVVSAGSAVPERQASGSAPAENAQVDDSTAEVQSNPTSGRATIQKKKNAAFLGNALLQLRAFFHGRLPSDIDDL